MKNKLRKLARRAGFFFLFSFIAFGLFTTFVPCKYSSRANVMRRLGFNLQADLRGSCEGWDCNCNAYTYNTRDCYYQNGCNQTSWGCGPFWYFECNSCTILPLAT